MKFPWLIPVGPWRLHPHAVFETAAYLVGFRLYLALRRRQGDAVSDGDRWSVMAAAALGAVIGSKVLFWFEDPSLTLRSWRDPAFLLGGKTIVGGLLGGLIAVEWVKRWIGVTISTGDLFAIPLAVGMAIGRVGCFLTGLDDRTHGTATGLPWAVDFGDGVGRHPTQLYEIVFLVVLAIVLALFARRARPRGDLFTAFMVGYLGFRLLVDGLKPAPRLVLGLSAIQWVALAGLAYYAPAIYGWIAAPRAREARIE